MNSIIKKYVDKAKNWHSEKNDIHYLIKRLAELDASLAETILVLKKLDFSEDDIDLALSESKIWKDHPISLDELFFDFVELDDDLIE